MDGSPILLRDTTRNSYRLMAETLDMAVEKIKTIQQNAREHGESERPLWPMIV